MLAGQGVVRQAQLTNNFSVQGQDMPFSLQPLVSPTRYVQVLLHSPPKAIMLRRPTRPGSRQGIKHHV